MAEKHHHHHHVVHHHHHHDVVHHHHHKVENYKEVKHELKVGMVKMIKQAVKYENYKEVKHGHHGGMVIKEGVKYENYKEVKFHEYQRHHGGMVAGTFALPGKHEPKKQLGHARMHKVKGETSAACGGGRAFHGHHEKKHG